MNWDEIDDATLFELCEGTKIGEFTKSSSHIQGDEENFSKEECSPKKKRKFETKRGNDNAAEPSCIVSEAIKDKHLVDPDSNEHKTSSDKLKTTFNNISGVEVKTQAVKQICTDDNQALIVEENISLNTTANLVKSPSVTEIKAESQICNSDTITKSAPNEDSNGHRVKNSVVITKKCVDKLREDHNVTTKIREGNTCISETHKNNTDTTKTREQNKDITKTPDKNIHTNKTHTSNTDITKTREAKEVKSVPESDPLHQYRRGYLWVSDLLSQAWCEQQMVYTFTLPTVVVENPVMTAGSEIHLARELEVQDVVQVKVTSSEDIFAVKVLNICRAAENLLQGQPVCREIPIFGAPFGDVFLMGMIDEIRCDQQEFTLELLEFKTRKFKSFPSKAQSLTHHLQVMIYKTLFNDLISGKTSKEVLKRHLKLDLHKPLGEDIMKHIQQAGLKKCVILDKLLDVLYERMSLLPPIDQMLVEYCWQEDNSIIGIKSMEDDQNLLYEKVNYYLKYWKGQRQACGVDIEDAWKCQRCDFADVCDWREQKAQQYACANAAKHSL